MSNETSEIGVVTFLDKYITITFVLNLFIKLHKFRKCYKKK